MTANEPTAARPRPAVMTPARVRTAKRRLRENHAPFEALIERVGPFRLKPEWEQQPFDALLRAIVFQSVSTLAARKIYGRVLDAIGREADQAGRVLELPPDRLREAGLSWAKVEACRDLARHRLEGRLPARSEAERLSDAELIEAMTRIRGIGRWTVEMLLIFSLGRLDVLPVDDLGVRRGYQLAFRKRREPTAKELRALGESWQPYRSVAAWYLWRANDLDW
ncbi:MAG: DNA-3-methyladenine glycosylase 2 family protein [Spirochaetales bacterium]|nr:DNA-3-methyladenine glycosylase 2 family protein [Leptospiraceae bacterium]MCP5481494.1 DNA-3-methyladenine glycosylase 2 family protein [Spirochaetales bacterium]MCP5484323.1 DNA-3-methyladenine glycosylase 2 family protein [Spirochaetales bacterium]